MRAADIKLMLLVVSILVLLVGASEAGIFQNAVSEGNRLNREGKYDEAIKKYDEAIKKTPESDVLNYNAGTAWYNKGDYQKALGHFIKSMSTKNPDIETRSTYNAGNSHYMIGKSIEEKNPSEAMASFENALQHYKRAIELNDTDTDARRNYELTNKKIQQLKEQQKDQKPKDKKDDNKDKKDDNKDKKDDNKDDNKDENKEDKKDDKDKDKDKDKEKDKDKNSSDKDKDGKQPDQSTPTPHPEKSQDMKGAVPPPMSKDEADMLLEGLKQDNVPRGMIDDKEKKGGHPNVLKDW
ncbi:tetratricopeptide repeat protein [Candidatus Magnetominusculus dajiuhuensis]|uniref:tetratricopeptide repeat protein n=1 Tax=Candidatus Magnetominusculus dajiuhuensis TaxID=3137712 RepID=UPI003B42C431